MLKLQGKVVGTTGNAIGGPQEWRFLVAGIDTLDLGFYVEWGQRWESLGEHLQRGKQAAERTQGILWDGCSSERCLILPSGKAPMYRYHLQLDHAHVFIQHKPNPANDPNVYVSITSESLWKRGVPAAVKAVQGFLEKLGGKIASIKASRVDLCADFLIPGGLGLAFLMRHKVTRAEHCEHHMKRDALGTFKVGKGKSPIQCRIYDKGEEIQSSGKTWFPDVWKLDKGDDVWRVEFQTRRSWLRQFHIDSVEDVLRWLGDLWEEVTRSYFSLRLVDDANTQRRTIHPWWVAVMQAGEAFARCGELERQYRSGTAPVGWYVSHISGCFVALAVRLGLADMAVALEAMQGAVRQYWQRRSFDDRYQVEAIRLGMPVGQEGGGHED